MTTPAGQYEFCAPPNWPAPPTGWRPPEGWVPEAAWGPAPEGWEFWRWVPAQPVAPAAAWSSPPVAPEPTAALPVQAASSPARAQATYLPSSGADSARSWVVRHKVATGAAGLLAVVAVAVSAGGSGSDVEVTPAAQAQVAGKASAGKAAAVKSAGKKAAEKKAADAKAAEKKAADAKAAAEAAAKNGPPEQQALAAAVVRGREAFEATDNELKQRQAQKARDRSLRSAIGGLRVSGWVGEIRSIDTNGEGKAVLELKVGDDVKVSTWNNAFSDYDDHTLISMDSAMYETLVDLEEGDRVRFSGTFFADPQKGLKEVSLTLRGQMTTPNFVFRFSKITPLG